MRLELLKTPGRRVLVRVLPIVMVLFSTSCFLTSELGLPPYNGVPGNEVRDRVSAAASVGFIIGRLTHSRDIGGRLHPDGGVIVNAWETGVMTAAHASVQDDFYYVLKSVKDCEERVLQYSAYYAFQLAQNAQGSDKPEAQEIVNGGTAAFAASECDLRKVGKLISVNEDINF